MENKKKIQLILLESIWIMKWNKEKTSLKAILNPEEADQMVSNIISNLNNAGYEIKKIKQEGE